MPSDDTTIPSVTPSSHQRRDPHTYPQGVAADAFHHYRHPPQAESLPCPRCDSNNTKFCYYNNYNLSQPRHFCKSCRRYWTHGGTLRNVPVGGGTRKSTSVSYPSSSNKRPRSSPSAVSPCSSSSALSGHDGPPGMLKLQEAGPGTTTGITTMAGGVIAGGGGGVLGSGFTTPLSPPGSNTFLALGGYEPTLDGLGRGVWPFAEAGFMEGGIYGSLHGAMAIPVGMETWHMGPGGGGDGDGGDGGGSREEDDLAWPELAISMPGQRQK